MGKLTQIASELNVSKSTVSRALRNDLRISDATRQAIKEKALQLGYATDSNLSMAMRQIRAGENRIGETVALWWPGTWNEITYTKEYPHYGMIINSIKKHASLTKVSIETPDSIGARAKETAAARIIATRGIRSIIFLPGDPEVYRINECFSKFIKIAIGNAVRGDVAARVSANFETVYGKIFDQLINRGYRMPGIIARVDHDRFSQMRLAGACAYYSEKMQLRRQIKTFTLNKNLDKNKYSHFFEWIKKNAIDVLISPNPELFEILRHEGNFNIPQDLAYVGTAGSLLHNEISGPRASYDVIGKDALLILLSHLQMPTHADYINTSMISLFVEPTWHEGITLPYIK